MIATALLNPPSSRRPFCCLLAFEIVHALHCVAHVLVSRLHVVRLLQLIRGQERPDLAHGSIDHTLRFFHRLLVDGDELRLRLIENGLDLCLLVRREIQSLGKVVQRVTVVPASWTPMATMRLGYGYTGAGD